MGKKRSGQTTKTLTRNQKRKIEYAKTMEKERAGKVGKRTKQQSAKTWVHERPCGNPACRSCYARYFGIGIVSIHEAPRMDILNGSKRVFA